MIMEKEPKRKIIILTHHSPTTIAASMDPRNAGSTISSGFGTALTAEVCWKS
jgi:hypothetical protein